MNNLISIASISALSFSLQAYLNKIVEILYILIMKITKLAVDKKY